LFPLGFLSGPCTSARFGLCGLQAVVELHLNIKVAMKGLFEQQNYGKMWKKRKN
jgi:hypothetical protein